MKKRAGYRRAFNRFDPRKLAHYDEGKVAELLPNPGIVRNQLKVTAAIQNPQAFLAIQKEFGSFDVYIWQFVGERLDLLAVECRERLLPSLGGHDQFVSHVGRVL